MKEIDLSVDMPADSKPLVLYVSLHVSDGLAITNSPSLYAWFLAILSVRLHIVDLGACSKFLRDRFNRRIWLIWLSSRVYIFLMNGT